MYYKNQKSIRIKVAIMFILLLIIFIISYRSIVDSQKDFIMIKIAFPTCENISIGSPVSIHGVDIGSVKKIILKENGVILYCKVYLPFALRENSKFKIKTKNLMGENKIAIIPSENGNIITDYNKVFTGESNDTIGELLTEIKTLSISIKDFLSDKNLKTNLLQTANNLNKISQDIYKFTQGDNLNKISKNLKNTLSDLDSIIISNKNDLNMLLKSGNKNLQKLINAQNSLQTLLNNLNLLINEALKNDNDINKLIKEKDFYNHIDKTSSKIDSLIDDIKANPKKYFNIKVF